MSETMKITLKDLTILNLHPVLIDIVLDLGAFNLSDIVVTSGYRPGDHGVHGTTPLRGIDLRCHNADLGRKIADYLNEKWVYDFNRPEKFVAIYHDIGLGEHLHLQCHHNTTRRV